MVISLGIRTIFLETFSLKYFAYSQSFQMIIFSKFPMYYVAGDFRRLILFVIYWLLFTGNQEVIEGLPDEQPRSDIDRMIAALAQRQHRQENASVESESSRNDAGLNRYAQRTAMRR